MSQIDFFFKGSNQIEVTIESNKIGNCESNPVGNGYQHGTADADDDASIRYLMRKWTALDAVLAVIMMTLEMHRDV